MERHAFFENRTERFHAVSCPGFSFPPHLHSQLELFFVNSGSAEVTAGNCTAVLQAGSLAVIFPNQIHSYQSTAERASITMLIADPSYTGGHLDSLLRFYPASPFLTKTHPNISYAVEELVKEHGKPEPDEAVYAPLIQLILARALPELELHKKRGDHHQDLIWQIANYVNAHYQEPLTLAALAKGVGISPGRLSHVFSEKIGQSFPAYLAHIRLSHAQTLLQGTELSVTEIGEESGFESQRTFFRIFRRYHGMTPMEYRGKSRAEGKTGQNLP